MEPEEEDAVEEAESDGVNDAAEESNDVVDDINDAAKVNEPVARKRKPRKE